MTTPVLPGYTLQQAQRDIASLRGQLAHLCLANPAGQLTYLGIDGNVYNTGNDTLTTTSPTTINSTSPQTIATWPVTAGTYAIWGSFVIQSVAVTDPCNFGLTTTGTAPNARIQYLVGQTGAFATAIIQSSRLGLIGPTLTSGINYGVMFMGVIPFTGSGTLSFQADMSAATRTWVLEDQAVFSLIPVT